MKKNIGESILYKFFILYCIQYNDNSLYARIYPNIFSEWLKNQHRDTYASHLGHYDQLSYFAVAQNDSIGRVKYQFLEVRK